VVAIVGPTAAGKTALSLALAHRLGGEVVNADSMQLYRGMDIGTAKLRPEQREGVPHHALDLWDVTEPASVAEYQRVAGPRIDAMARRGRVPLLVGGSGLYVRAVLEQFEFPGTDAELRAELEAELAAHGPAPLHARLAERDPPRRPGSCPATAGGSSARSRWCSSPADRSRPSCPNPRRTIRPSTSESTWTPPSSTSASSGGWSGCGPTASSTRCARSSGRACATAAPPAGALGYQQVLRHLAGDGTEDEATPRHRRRDPPVRAPPAVLVPPRPAHHLARRRATATDRRAGDRLVEARSRWCDDGGDGHQGVAFAKGHGTGNDFVLIPDPDGELDAAPADVAAAVRPPARHRRRRRAAGRAHRRRPEVADRAGEAEWFMDYRNADGSLAEMCGNGVRVYARYLVESGLAPGPRVDILTRAGLVAAEVGDETVAVRMPMPQLYGLSSAVVSGVDYSGMVVTAGNPNLVCWVDDPAAVDLGRAPVLDPATFPDGANVEFIAPVDARHVRMRVIERGVGETQSCGSGACAVAAVVLRDEPAGTVTIDVPGGRLTVTLDEQACVLAGPAVIVAAGTLTV
jgi:diaminopimelate epimerase